MRIKDLTSAAAADKALAECDSLGRQAFLARHK